MKLVPYKCKFGHITIKEFSGATTGIVECEKCEQETTNKIMKYDHPYNDKNYMHLWPSNKLKKGYVPEKAVRI